MKKRHLSLDQNVPLSQPNVTLPKRVDIKMAIVEKKDDARIKEIDKGIKNKFCWEWMEEEAVTLVNKKSVNTLYGDFIRK